MWKWLSADGNPLTWTTYGLIASQLGDVHDQFIALEDGTQVLIC